MIARWTGLQFEGSTEFAGYAMAATSFFALAHALTYGAHIRVSILLNISAFTKFWLNGFAMYVSAITATYFARYAVKTNFMSQVLNDRTQGQDQLPDWLISLIAMIGTAPGDWGVLWAETGTGWAYTPVWVPQIVMSIGSIILAIALWDHLIRLFVDGESSIRGETV
jgi:TRAP-type C4-dicarboxylate transport system permease small subunit